MDRLHIAPAQLPLAGSAQQLRAFASSTIPVHPDGPLYDEVAQALALGAAARVEQGQAWNSLTIDDATPYSARVFLAQQGVNSTDDWTSTVGDALNPDGGDIDLVLGFRAEMMRSGEVVTTGLWRDEMHRWLAGDDQTPDAHDTVDRIISTVDEIDGWIADVGLLEPGIKVRDIFGYRISWAVTVARWGAYSGYGDYAAVRQTLLAARDVATRYFIGWNEFAASVIVGSALNDDDPRAGFDGALPHVASLLTALDSPWRNLEFPTGTDFDF
ncbi:hypothetical protein ACH46_03640 [Gordonia phthalatica]|uniref:DUF1266 domain-containing protein n=1 Tax=Gordonia phthalatica TaxID=1136941 RepID=A0A0N7FU99_9ACTN|nr:hypothetical protein ACH46_03640 [Gordonia phthalatica]